jgi:hypothetical protein
MFRDFDSWLTTQPDSGPILHSYEEIKNAAEQSNHGESDTVFTLAFNNFDELRCDLCNKPVGYLLHDDNVPPTCSIVEFWQVDEDGEHLLCEECYENVTKEIG